MKMLPNFLKTQSNSTGASLIEVLVSLGLLTIIMFAVSSLIVSQQKEVQALSESLARLEVEKLLIGTLADGKVCTKLLVNKKFTAAHLVWQPALGLTGVPANDLPGALNIISTTAVRFNS